MFLSTEGLDGVGKSTVAEQLARHLDIKFYSPARYDTLGRGIRNWSVELHFLYYLWVNYQLGQVISEMGNNAVVDSHVLRTITAHEAIGLNTALLTLAVPLIKRINKPGLTALLVCSHEERIRRLKSRTGSIGKSDIVDRTTEEIVLTSYSKWAKKLDYPLQRVDTSFKPPSEVVSIIIYSLANLKI